jgi:hypothetical protein
MVFTRRHNNQRNSLRGNVVKELAPFSASITSGLCVFLVHVYDVGTLEIDRFRLKGYSSNHTAKKTRTDALRSRRRGADLV